MSWWPPNWQNPHKFSRWKGQAWYWSWLHQEQPTWARPVASIELETSGYFSSTLNLNKKRKRSNSLPLSYLHLIGDILNFLHVKQWLSTLTVRENHSRKLNKYSCLGFIAKNSEHWYLLIRSLGDSNAAYLRTTNLCSSLKVTASAKWFVFS